MVLTDTALKIMQERGTWICECCGINPAEECHHALYGRDNSNKKAKKLLNLTYNLMLVCEDCHSGPAKTYANKLRFWAMQCERYGKGVMLDWHERVPYKIKVIEYR